MTIALIASLGIAACGGGDTSQTDETREGTSLQAGDTPGARHAEAACEKAPKAALRAIEQGLRLKGGKLRHGYIVQSKDSSDVYMIAADLQSAGLKGEDDIAVWATESPSGAEAIFAANGVAQTFSESVDADDSDSPIDQSGISEGVERAKDCLKKGQAAGR